MLLFQTAEAPGLEVNRGVVAATALAFSALSAGRRLRWFFAAIGGRSTTGREGMIGAVGTVRRRIAPLGKVAVVGELWDAEARDGATLEEGSTVEVVAVQGLRLVVAPLRR